MISFRLNAATALTIALTGTAFAADLPLRSAPPAFVAPLPVFTWTGFYLGANAGYAFDGNTRVNLSGVTAGNAAAITGGFRPGRVNINDSGFTGGGQIGYNYQFGGGSGVVVGVEADAAYTDLGRTITYAPVIGGLTYPTTFHSSLDYLGTVRGRLGYAFNQFLIYGTGGFAYGEVNSNSTLYSTGGVPIFTGSRSTMRTGYTYGGGVEYALPTNSFLNFFHSSAVTVKAEYLHYNLGTTNVALNPVNFGVGAFNARFRTDGDLVRAGINYKF